MLYWNYCSSKAGIEIERFQSDYHGASESGFSKVPISYIIFFYLHSSRCISLLLSTKSCTNFQASEAGALERGSDPLQVKCWRASNFFCTLSSNSCWQCVLLLSFWLQEISRGHILFPKMGFINDKCHSVLYTFCTCFAGQSQQCSIR